MQFDEYRNYLDRQTGQVEILSMQVLRMAEEGDDGSDLPDWQQREFESPFAGVRTTISNTATPNRAPRAELHRCPPAEPQHPAPRPQAAELYWHLRL